MIRWRKKTVWMRNITYSGLFMKFFFYRKISFESRGKYSGLNTKKKETQNTANGYDIQL